ncbi:hypothetical protein ACIQNU_13155 [Streptomyces sp. NPDC091292]|uniref:hypothetical protein n=1 Tax=Streptomyces sp. NPDC091292 TaxID=3365991 RepID=UPI00382822D0
MTAHGTRQEGHRRGAVDPVKALMHRHRDLCERAVDPLEIAAGLEAHGVTDRTATRFRHRDVFSLAEEIYARVPRGSGNSGTVGPSAAGQAAGRPPRTGEPLPTDDGDPLGTGALGGRTVRNAPVARAGRAALALVPGAVCALVLAGLRTVDGRWHLALLVLGTLTVATTLRIVLRYGPLRVPHARVPGATAAWTACLLLYAAAGDGLLRAAVGGGPDASWPLATAPLLGLTLAVAPGVWCAWLFAHRAARRLTTSHGLDDFAASVRPLLLGVLTLFLGALSLLLWSSATVLDQPSGFAGPLALGVLLLLARLLTVRGFSHAPAVVLGAAGAGELFCLATVFAGRLPGCGFLSVPVDTAVDRWGPGAVPAVICGTAALILLIHATRTLTRASAHATAGGAP